jgi:hypothetical protein
MRSAAAVRQIGQGVSSRPNGGAVSADFEPVRSGPRRNARVSVKGTGRGGNLARAASAPRARLSGELSDSLRSALEASGLE